MIRDRDVIAGFIDTIRRLVADRLVPAEAEVDATDRIPDALLAEMKAMGLFGMTIPEEYGGLGLTMEEEVLVTFELGRAAPAFRSSFGTNNGIGAMSLIVGGSEEQKRRYLPRMASGELISSFALTEPEAGSDAASLRTSARRDGDDFVLNGSKRFITNAPVAGLFTVFARTGPEAISAFLIEAPRPGLAVGRPDRKMGQKGAHTADVVLTDCRVPATALLAKEGEGFRLAMRTLDRGRLHIAALCTGIAERLIADAVDFAKARVQFGKPIAEFQLVQALLADSRTEAYAARSMVLETARARDEGRPVTMEASCCKLFASEMVGRVADRAVQIHGGSGYMAEMAVERLYRDVRLFRLYEGTSQIQQLVIAGRMLREGA